MEEVLTADTDVADRLPGHDKSLLSRSLNLSPKTLSASTSPYFAFSQLASSQSSSKVEDIPIGEEERTPFVFIEHTGA